LAIAQTHLEDFFDAHDLAPGSTWDAVLQENASNCAMLAIRTDLYAGREWTQREVLAAKRHDVPIVTLMALQEGEARGSFLMDHVPSVPFDRADAATSIERGLGRLVDEVLKRALWQAQAAYVTEQGFDWTPVHAPEPVTAVKWLADHRASSPDDQHAWVIHPDPPLGPAELAVATEVFEIAGFDRAKVEILTPRTFASRGGMLPHEPRS
jgi:hypothetical protein